MLFLVMLLRLMVFISLGFVVAYVSHHHHLPSQTFVLVCDLRRSNSTHDCCDRWMIVAMLGLHVQRNGNIIGDEDHRAKTDDGHGPLQNYFFWPDISSLMMMTDESSSWLVDWTYGVDALGCNIVIVIAHAAGRESGVSVVWIRRIAWWV
jgi:hypothetical protein